MEFSYPLEMEKAKKEKWPVILPVGNMEYHSAHCPYGCDSLVAMGVAREYAKRRECVVLPPVYYGFASYAVGGPETNTINMDPDVLEAYVYNILKSLFKSGFTRNICIVIFHQSEDFNPTALACMKAARKLIFEYLEETDGEGWWGRNKKGINYDDVPAKEHPWNWIRVFNGGRTDKFPGDHAGKYECSLLEYLYPGSVKTERITPDSDWFAENAKEMSAEMGKEWLEAIFEKMDNAIDKGTKPY